MYRISDLIKPLFLGKYGFGAELTEYDDILVLHAIDNIVESHVDVDDDKIVDYLTSHVTRVNGTINRYGWRKCECDLLQAARYAQGDDYGWDILVNLNDCLMYYALHYYINRSNGAEFIPSDLADGLWSLVGRCKYLYEITNYIDSYCACEFGVNN